MALEKGPFKLDLEKENDPCPFPWVGHPDGDDPIISARRKDMIIIGGITMEVLDYVETIA